MAKPNGRIPASQVMESKAWSLAEVEPDNPDVNRVFRLKSRIAPARMDPGERLKSPAKPKPEPVQPTVAVQKPAEVPVEPAVIEPEMAPLLEEPLSAGLPLTADAGLADIQEAPDAGQTETFESGYADGFLKGETEGFIKGESEGYSAGELAGREAGQRAFEAEIASQKLLLQDLTSSFSKPPDHGAELNPLLADLIRQVAEIVILGELKTEPDHIERLINAALLALPHGSRKVQVKVNPEHLSWLDEHLPISDTDVNYVAEPKLAPGSCMISSEQSAVDGRLSERIHQCLLRACRGEALHPVTEAGLIETASQLGQDQDAR